MRKISCVLALLVLAAGAAALHGDARKPKPKDEPGIMRQKLGHSQKILEGLAQNDFDLIDKSARELMDLSKQAEWKALKTAQYELYSNEFRRNAESLAQAAKARNLDAATLAYVDLTLNCVKCHRHTRDVRMTRRD